MTNTFCQLAPKASFLDILFFGCAGFSSGKAETQSSDLSEACGTMQDDKVTAFRPVMKRWSRWVCTELEKTRHTNTHIQYTHTHNTKAPNNTIKYTRWTGIHTLADSLIVKSVIHFVGFFVIYKYWLQNDSWILIYMMPKVIYNHHQNMKQKILRFLCIQLASIWQ